MAVRLNRNIHIADAGYTVAYKQSNGGEARCRTVKSVRQQRDEIKIIHRKRRDAVNRIGAVVQKHKYIDYGSNNRENKKRASCGSRH